jgi:hypothetical protein
MLKIIMHDPKCDPCVRCTCGAEPIQGRDVVFDVYIELSDSTVIVHVASDYMVNFDCANAAGARALADVMARSQVGTDGWYTRGVAQS